MNYPDQPPRPTRQVRPNRPAPLPRIARSTALARTAVIGLILVALVFSGLTWQMIIGGDPALGSSGHNSKSTTTAASSPPTPDVQPTPPAVVEDDGVVVQVPQTPTVQPQSVPAPTPVQSTPS